MLTPDELWNHPFTKHLIDRGFTLSVYHQDKPNQPFLGLRFFTQNSEIAYAFDCEDVVRLVFYRRLKDRSGVTNSFKDFVWFINETAKPEFKIRGIIGVVSPSLDKYSDALSADRLSKLYSKLTGTIVEKKFNLDTYFGDYKNIEEFRRIWGRKIIEPIPGEVPNTSS